MKKRMHESFPRISWFRSYGNENSEFDENGLMRLRLASINDLPIKETKRK
jgi:nuclear transport factor 2 (NTF2) superfamily protein